LASIGQDSTVDTKEKAAAKNIKKLCHTPWIAHGSAAASSNFTNFHQQTYILIIHDLVFAIDKVLSLLPCVDRKPGTQASFSEVPSW
jgi:predicted tellurium resistance membrane protein TerC